VIGSFNTAQQVSSALSLAASTVCACSALTCQRCWCCLRNDFVWLCVFLGTFLCLALSPPLPFAMVYFQQLISVGLCLMGSHLWVFASWAPIWISCCSLRQGGRSSVSPLGWLYVCFVLLGTRARCHGRTSTPPRTCVTSSCALLSMRLCLTSRRCL
jgi:hypothetical protein